MAFQARMTADEAAQYTQYRVPRTEPAPVIAQGGANRACGEANPLSAQLFQLVSASLEGPKGIDPASFVAAFGALAGHGARWTVRRQIADGMIEDDFVVPTGVRRPGITISPKVSCQVHDMTAPSYAATLIPAMIAAGADWLPTVDTMLQHNFMAINAPTYPDYTVQARYFPAIPPQTLLMMLWEQARACLDGTPDVFGTIQPALAQATVMAAKTYSYKLPLAVSGQLALETAIATSKLDYGF